MAVELALLMLTCSSRERSDYLIYKYENGDAACYKWKEDLQIADDLVSSCMH